MGDSYMRHKRGDVGDDGRFFWSYRNGKEVWLTEEKFIRAKIKKLEWQRNNINHEENRKNVKEWTARNYARKLARVRKYQAIKRNSKILTGDIDCIKVFYEAAKRVGNCLGIKFHVDHIIPLSIGGSHHQSNLQWVPQKWNISKLNRSSKLFAT